MAITDEERDRIIQSVLAEMQANSEGTDNLTVVDTLSGITTLPAMKGTKAVAAPVSLLEKPAKDAAARANAAAASAAKAATDAAREASGARTQAERANAAGNMAYDAAAKADKAVKAMAGQRPKFSGCNTADNVTKSTQDVTGKDYDIVYMVKDDIFAAKVITGTGIGGTPVYGYFNNWMKDGNYDECMLYNNSTRDGINTEKIYINTENNEIYIYDEYDNMLVSSVKNAKDTFGIRIFSGVEETINGRLADSSTNSDEGEVIYSREYECFFLKKDERTGQLPYYVYYDTWPGNKRFMQLIGDYFVPYMNVLYVSGGNGHYFDGETLVKLNTK